MDITFKYTWNLLLFLSLPCYHSGPARQDHLLFPKFHPEAPIQSIRATKQCSTVTVESLSLFKTLWWILSSVRVKVKGSPPLLSSLTSSTIHSPLGPLCFNHTGLLALAQTGHLCSCLSFTQNLPPLVSVSPPSLLARGQLFNVACFITLFNTATPSPVVLIPLAALFFFLPCSPFHLSNLLYSWLIYAQWSVFVSLN